MNLRNDYSILSDKARDYLRGRKQLFINGRWQEGASGETLTVTDPSSGEAICDIAAGDARDVDAAVLAARAAFETGPWAKMRPMEREALMLRLAERLEREALSLAEIETVNSGKLINNTRLFDVDFSAYTLRYMAGWATKLHGQTMDLSVPYAPGQRFDGFTRRYPAGVVGAITPWNVPLGQAVWKLAPVMATGCTLVLKPAEQTSLTALRLAELCAEVGVPDGVFNVVTGVGAVAGAALAAHPGIDKISFTGSTNVGRQIAETAARQFKRCSLELGGKSPSVIAADADLELAIPGAAWAIYGNHGQNCCAGSRLFIHQSVYREVIEGVARIANEINLGPGLDRASTMGPLVSHQHRNRVLGYVNDAIESGAAVLAGGEAPDAPGAYMKPTILSGLSHDHRAVQEEIFGPVLAVFSYSSDDEALRLANQTKFGLGASIWTRSLDTADKFYRGFKAGTVWVNTHNILDFSVPFGGVKESGIGHELGEEGVLSHTSTKACIRRLAPE